METSSTSDFVSLLPIIDDFSNALPLENYAHVPDDWYVACSDVVASRKAISEGKYKAVNMAGVAMISAIMNVLDHQNVPYIFGGDGAAVVFSPLDHDVIKEALSRTVRWVEAELGLELRAAIVPVSELKAAGYDVLTVAVRVSPAISNFAFAGGGVGAAEAWMKDGRFIVDPAPPGEVPDLSGLSCRWTPVSQSGRKIVSVILEPVEGELEIPEDILRRLFDMLGKDDAATRPMPAEGPGFSWPPAGVHLESRATGMSKGLLYAITLLAWILDKTGIPLGQFDPKRYRSYTAMNTDYRKIQDGLRMTLALDDEGVKTLNALLEEGYLAGKLRYGICEQDSAVLTCFVPSIMEDNHFHFLDGAGGGYAQAASNMK